MNAVVCAVASSWDSALKSICAAAEVGLSEFLMFVRATEACCMMTAAFSMSSMVLPGLVAIAMFMVPMAWGLG